MNEGGWGLGGWEQEEAIKGRREGKERSLAMTSGRDRGRSKEGVLHTSMTSHRTLVHTVFFFSIISFMRASSTLSRSSCNRRCCSRTVSMVTTHTAVDRARYTHSDLKAVL